MGKNNLYWQNVAFALFLIIVVALFWIFANRALLISKIALSVILGYFAAIVFLIPFKSNRIASCILNWIIVPTSHLYKVCDTKRGGRAFTVSLAIALSLLPVAFILVLPSMICGLSLEWTLVIIYVLLVAAAYFITTNCFASFFNRVVQVEPMAPFQVGMGKQVINVVYLILVASSAISSFLMPESPALLRLFIPVFLTYIALDRIRMQRAQNKASEITEK